MGSLNLWYQKETDEILKELNSTTNGISSENAAERVQKYGKNELPQKPPESVFLIFFRQINNPLIYVLMASALLAILMGEFTDGMVVAGVVLVNAIIGFFQEYRSSREIAALKQMVPEKAVVLRDGVPFTIDASNVVPGDIVLLQAGDKIPADMRLFEAKGFKTSEAALTGESLPVNKISQSIKENAALGDQRSIAFSGTSVVSGVAKGIVVETGLRTELGKINVMLKETTKTETPLTRSIAKVATNLTIMISAVSVILFGVALLRGYPLVDAVLASITLAVAAIPEGIPAVITIALAIGVRRMAHRRAVVRHLPAVETLGSTTVICSDKTGTITKNEMTVKQLQTLKNKVFLSGTGYDPHGSLEIDGTKISELSSDIYDILLAGILCNDAFLKNEKNSWQIEGDPTEGALLTSAQKAGLQPQMLRDKYKRLDIIPFDSDYKFMAVLNMLDNKKVMFLKGAAEVIVDKCDLDAEQKERVRLAISEMADNGMRVLGFAQKEISGDTLIFDNTENGLEFLGLQAIIDPPREEVKRAVEQCHRAGITVKMITGDHQATAAAIGKSLGIMSGAGAVAGNSLDSLSEDEIVKVSSRSNIFARVAPEHKLKLVAGLQKNGDVVAMTGDGVNDAPALKKADIGVAMGITGTAVSRDSADIILTDDNFATIVSAVEEGRRVYDNLIKAMAFALPTNVGEALILLVAVAFFPVIQGVPLLPMSPVQILWINLVATVSLALPLAFESKERDIMSRPPRKPGEPILNKFVLFRTVLVAIIITAVGIGLFLNTYNSDLQSGGSVHALSKAQTMAVTSIVFLQIFYMLNCRSLKKSIFSIGFFSNYTVFVGIFVLLLLQIAYVYLPFMNELFYSYPLSFGNWVESALYGLVVLPVISVEKWIRNRRKKG